VVARHVGINGTRFVARRGAEDVAYVEVEVLDAGERHHRRGGLADIGNLHVVPDHRRQGVATWLVGHAARWLRLGHVDRLLHYAGIGEDDLIAFVESRGFVEVTRTRRGWRLPVP
jgi:GNAT superfamily N-acetyltransferase